MPIRDEWSNALPIEHARSQATTFMAKVYRWMAMGLLLTGLAAYAVTEIPALQQAILGNKAVFYGLIIAEFVMVLGFSAVAARASFAAAALMFLAYCALSGLTFSVFFFAYTRESIASTFALTGGTFGAMSIYGTITKRDLSSWGQFLMMGLVGIVLASVVNIFVGSSMVQFIVSCAGVLVFTGLAAYDTQKIRALAESGDERHALRGALVLYLDFINLFIMLMNLTGRRR